jgi:predicted DNA binding CopG/RHH family protein
MANLNLTQLIRRRAQICEAIAKITSMRRGTLNEVYRHQKLKDGTMATRGPFYNITTKAEKNKTVTVAVPKSDLDRIRREVQNYKDFRALSDEYIDICEQISLLTGSDDDKDRE